MRQGGPGNNRRPRGRHHNGGNGSNGGGGGGGPSGNPMGGGNRPRSAASLRHQTFDSNGPDVRVRGNAWQVYEKYQSLARDVAGSGDKVLAESYLQHAEHYYRIIEAINEATAAEQRVRGVYDQPYDQQPNVPPNYYGTEGNPTTMVPSAPSNDGAAQPVMAQAEVQSKNQPVIQPTPFFQQEDSEETSGPVSLVANR